MAQDLPIRYHGNRDTRRQGALNRFRLWTAALENETVRPVVADCRRGLGILEWRLLIFPRRKAARKHDRKDNVLLRGSQLSCVWEL